VWAGGGGGSGSGGKNLGIKLWAGTNENNIR